MSLGVPAGGQCRQMALGRPASGGARGPGKFKDDVSKHPSVALACPSRVTSVAAVAVAGGLVPSPVGPERPGMRLAPPDPFPGLLHSVMFNKALKL